MRRSFYFLIVLAFIFGGLTSTVHAQSVDDILATYFEATGGLTNWKNIKSLKTTGKMMQGGMEFPAVSQMKAPNKYRMDITVQGQTIVQAYDGKDAWMINPMMQIMEPKKLTEQEAAAFANKPIESEFIDYKSKGHQVELGESEEVNGMACYQLKLTKKDGTVEYHFFDKDTGVPLMVRVIAPEGPMKGQPIESYIGDYDTVGGFLMPFTVTTKVQGQTMMEIKYDKYEVNGNIDDAVFSMPAK